MVEPVQMDVLWEYVVKSINMASLNPKRLEIHGFPLGKEVPRVFFWTHHLFVVVSGAKFISKGKIPQFMVILT